MLSGTVSVGFPVFVLQSTVTRQIVHVPTVFERMVLRLCAKYREVPEIGRHSLREVFEQILGVANSAALVDPIVESMVSFGLVERPGSGQVLDTPLAQLSLTKKGQDLLSEGRFPSRSRPEQMEHVLFPLSGEVRERTARDVVQVPPEQVHVDEFLLRPGNCADLVRQSLAQGAGHSAESGTEVLSVESRIGGTFWTFHRVAVGCDKAGIITVLAPESPEVQRWLENAVAETIWNAILDPVLITDSRAAAQPSLDVRTLRGVAGIRPCLAGETERQSTGENDEALLRVVVSQAASTDAGGVPTVCLDEGVVTTGEDDRDRFSLDVDTLANGGLPLGFACLTLGLDRVPKVDLKGFCQLYWAGEPRWCLASVRLELSESSRVWNSIRASLEDALARARNRSLAALRGVWESPQSVIREWLGKTRGKTLGECVRDAAQLEHSLLRFHGQRSSKWLPEWQEALRDVLTQTLGDEAGGITSAELKHLLTTIPDVAAGWSPAVLSALLARTTAVNDVTELLILRKLLPSSTYLPQCLFGDDLLKKWIGEAVSGQALELGGPHAYSQAIPEFADACSQLRRMILPAASDAGNSHRPKVPPKSAAFEAVDRWRTARQRLVELLPTHLRSRSAMTQVDRDVHDWMQQVAGFFAPELSLDGRLVVLDTNVLLESPQIVDGLRTGDVAVVPKRVLEELDGLKRSKDDATARAARLAIRLLDRAGERIRSGSEALELLPPGMDVRAPDNCILSVALRLRLNDVVLVTFDQNLRVKARGEYIVAMSPEEYRAGPTEQQPDAGLPEDRQ